MMAFPARVATSPPTAAKSVETSALITALNAATPGLSAPSTAVATSWPAKSARALGLTGGAHDGLADPSSTSTVPTTAASNALWTPELAKRLTSAVCMSDGLTRVSSAPVTPSS